MADDANTYSGGVREFENPGPDDPELYVEYYTKDDVRHTLEYDQVTFIDDHLSTEGMLTNLNALLEANGIKQRFAHIEDGSSTAIVMLEEPKE
jgi:hypothetical protein